MLPLNLIKRAIRGLQREDKRAEFVVFEVHHDPLARKSEVGAHGSSNPLTLMLCAIRALERCAEEGSKYPEVGPRLLAKNAEQLLLLLRASSRGN